MKEVQRHFRRTHLGLCHLPFTFFIQSRSIGNACSVPVPPIGAGFSGTCKGGKRRGLRGRKSGAEGCVRWGRRLPEGLRGC